MNLSEYATYDGLGLAELVAKRQVSPKELAETALKAIEAANPDHQRGRGDLSRTASQGLDESALGNGPFRGVPFLIKDVLGPREGPQDRVRQPAVPRHAGRGRHPRRRAVPGQRRQHPGPLGGAGILDGGHHRSRSSSATPPIPGSRATRPAARPAAARRRSPRAWCRWRTAPTSADRCAFRRAGAAASRLSPRAGASPAARRSTRAVSA